MAHSEPLAVRVRDHLGAGAAAAVEKKMFGGIAWMVQGHMCVGVIDDHLVVRVAKEDTAAVTQEPHVRPMDFTGRPMRGFVYVEPPALAGAGLAHWIDRALAYVTALPAK